MSRRLEGKIAVICGAGASQGGVSIGMATALTFAREGARVFAVDRDIALAEGPKAAIEIGRLGARQRARRVRPVAVLRT